MAVETKPLFNPELVRQQVHTSTLPDTKAFVIAVIFSKVVTGVK